MALLAICLALCFFAPQALAADSIKLFSIESAARAHCPGDIIVWFNTSTNTYYYYGQAQYEHTEPGAYACKTEVDRVSNSTTGQH
jgi:hypothetical protein